MLSLVDWLVNISVTLYTYLMTDITDDTIILYMAYAFCLIAVLALVVCCLSLVPLLFRFINDILKGASK